MMCNLQKIDAADHIIKHSNRKAWIDFLRALAMLFVIFGHQVPSLTPYFVFTSPIKIPLFFMITGYVFNDKRTSTYDFFKNIFLKLIIPWLCLTVPFIIIKIPFRGMSVFINEMYKLISGETAWYMPCCIIAEIIWLFTRKFLRRTSLTCLGVFFVFSLGVFSVYLNILNYAMLNRAMLMQIFILSGYLYRKNEERFSKFSWNSIIALFIIYIAMGGFSLKIWPGKCLDVHLNKYYNWPFCFIMMLYGCFTMFIFANKLVRIPRILSFIGQNTLVYYLLHSYNIQASVRILSVIKIDIPDSLIGACIKTIIACIACAIEAMLINRFLPEIVGKKRKRC